VIVASESDVLDKGVDHCGRAERRADEEEEERHHQQNERDEQVHHHQGPREEEEVLAHHYIYTKRGKKRGFERLFISDVVRGLFSAALAGHA
jgi:hypothetical protein